MSAQPRTSQADVDASAEALAAFNVSWRERDLCLGLVSLSVLGERWGTPTYVYGREALLARYDRFAAAFAGRPTRIMYAAKANPHLALLAALAEAGAGVDVSSIGELQRAVHVGFSPDKIVFSGVAKRDDEIDAALEIGIAGLHVGSLDEIDRVAARARARARGEIATIALRIKPDVETSTHRSLQTGQRVSKFGIDLGDIEEALRRVAQHDGVVLVGLSCHIGSQIVDAGPFCLAAQRMMKVVADARRMGHQLRYLDLGGGMGVGYRVGEPGLVLEEFGARLTRLTADEGLDLLVEPGRALVANAGVLLTRVIGHKRSAGRTIALVDAGYTDLARPALYDAYHVILPCRRPPPDTLRVPVDVAGPICDSSDWLARARPMVVPKAGEVLAILSAGAYGMSMASTFAARPLPAELLLDGTHVETIRPRQTVAELMAAEHVPARRPSHV